MRHVSFRDPQCTHREKKVVQKKVKKLHASSLPGLCSTSSPWEPGRQPAPARPPSSTRRSIDRSSHCSREAHAMASRSSNHRRSKQPLPPSKHRRRRRSGRHGRSKQRRRQTKQRPGRRSKQWSKQCGRSKQRRPSVEAPPPPENRSKQRSKQCWAPFEATVSAVGSIAGGRSK